VAKLTGQSSAAHLSHWERAAKTPNLKNALMLSAALKCPVEILFLDLFNQVRKEVYENQTKHAIEPKYN
jgi:transcriptional regulator with XRE-family HTH domain